MSINGIPPSENDVVEVYLSSIKKLVAEMTEKIVKLETGNADQRMDLEVMVQMLQDILPIANQWLAMAGALTINNPEAKASLARQCIIVENVKQFIKHQPYIPNEPDRKTPV